LHPVKIPECTALRADHLHVVGRRLRLNKYLWAQQYTANREMIAPACGDKLGPAECSASLRQMSDPRVDEHSEGRKHASLRDKTNT
jgi:hypothetical protein